MDGWNPNPFRRRKAWEFQKARFAETVQELGNPACGWYRIYTVRLEEPAEDQIAQWYLDEKEQLALLRIDIGGYRARALDDFALEQLRKVMLFFRGTGKDMILRPLYDTQGCGLEREPAKLERVCEHLRQLFSVLREFEDCIYIVQGILLGSWGEMHSSRFLKKSSICLLMGMLENLTGPDVFLAVRRPVFYRMLRSAKVVERKIGLFDDAILGSDTDLGTFGWEPEAGWEAAWLPEQELRFERKLCRTVPQGGELLPDPAGFPPLAVVAARMRKMHISYLNNQHDPEALACLRQQSWQAKDIWNAVNGFDYIGCHLGYRYRLRDTSVRWDAKTRELQICVEIENAGFAPCYQALEASVIQVLSTGERRKTAFAGDLRTLDGGQKLRLLCRVVPANGELYLQLHRCRDGRPIHLATVVPGQEGNGLLLGTVVGRERA